MILQLFVGDLLRVRADAICTSTNPWLSLQAGTGGAARLFGGHAIQEACDALLAAQQERTGRRHFPTGSAHLTPAGSLAFRGIVHCVAIDAFHGSSEEIIGSCVREALAVAEHEGFDHLAMPSFATGNGRFPLDRSLGAMLEALHRHQGGSVWRVSIAVPDDSRAAEARRILSQGRPLGVGSERDPQLHAWVTPIYQQVLHGSHLGLQGDEREEFVAAARRAVSEADEAGLRLLLWDGNWRPRLVAAWLAGIVQARRLTPLLAELLLESEVTYAGQGYCFALARFGTPEAALALDRYLERWLPQVECAYDQDWALAALFSIDEGRARKHLGAWAAFGDRWRMDGAGELDKARARLAAVIAFADQNLLPG